MAAGELGGDLVGENQALIDVATAAVAPNEVKADPKGPKHYAVVVPNGGKVEHLVIDDEKAGEAPRRTTGSYTLETVGSFIDFVKAQDDKRLTVWVNEKSHLLTAVFNDGTPVKPGWRDHRAVSALALTDEWKHWMSLDGQLVSQQQFAEHVEDGLREIVDPTAADVLEMAQTFFAKTEASFRSAQRLSSGEVQFKYDEETTATAGASGQMEIPQTLMLAIAPFPSEDAAIIEARLRYRVSGGTLRLGYKLDHPERVLRTVMEGIATKLKVEFPGRVYAGSPA